MASVSGSNATDGAAQNDGPISPARNALAESIRGPASQDGNTPPAAILEMRRHANSVIEALLEVGTTDYVNFKQPMQFANSYLLIFITF